MLHCRLILWHFAKNPISDTKNFKQNLVNLVNEYKYQLPIEEKLFPLYKFKAIPTKILIIYIYFFYHLKPECMKENLYLYTPF